VLILANPSTLDLKTTSSTVMVITTPIALIQPQNVLTSTISSIPMARACQAAHIPVEMSGAMDPISAIPLVCMDYTLIPRQAVVWTCAKLKIFDLKIISVIAMKDLIPITAPIQLQDVPTSTISNIKMTHVCQAALTHIEMSGMMDHISVYPLVLMEDTLIL